MDVVQLLEAMIRFPSLSGKEREIADFVQDYVESRGLRARRHDDNISFALGEGSRRLLLNSHLDVVPASDGHPYPPFEPVCAHGRLFGRGSVDAKASGAAMTTAVLELNDEGWMPDGQVIVALTTFEEAGKGYNGMEAMRTVLPAVDAALVGEPTEMQPCIAQKGLLILSGIARGRSAHAARASLGDNAIERAARDIARVASFHFERSDPDLGEPTVAVTTIAGGSARNVVPDECRFTLDIRSTPAYSHEELTDVFRHALESDIEIHSDRIVPVRTDADHAIVRACLKALPGAATFGSPTTSDWIFLRDVPTVKIGPGDSRLSHTADESIPINHLRDAVEGYKRIIKAYFGATL